MGGPGPIVAPASQRAGGSQRARRLSKSAAFSQAIFWLKGRPSVAQRGGGVPRGRCGAGPERTGGRASQGGEVGWETRSPRTVTRSRSTVTRMVDWVTHPGSQSRPIRPSESAGDLHLWGLPLPEMLDRQHASHTGMHPPPRACQVSESDSDTCRRTALCSRLWLEPAAVFASSI